MIARMRSAYAVGSLSLLVCASCSPPAASPADSDDASTTVASGSDTTTASSADATTSPTATAETTGASATSDGSDSTGGTVDPPMTDCNAVPCFYVAAGSAPGNDGSSWASPLPALPDEPQRGAVYFFADGDYGDVMLDAPEADEAWITLRKATVVDHGTDEGWVDDLGDAQAVFGEIAMVSDRWVLDGQTRNEADWTDVDAYGFRVLGRIVGHTINYGRASNDAAFQYIDLGGEPTGEFDPSLPSEAFYFGGFDAVIRGWTISRCHMHDVYLPVQLAGAEDVLIEHSHLGPNWSKETVRGQGHAARIVIRHNVFKDGCQGTPGDPTAPGCTAQIAMWDGDEPGAFDGSEIYGNVIWTTKATGHSDGCVLVGGDGGVSLQGVTANDVLIANNTFVGVQQGRCSLRCAGDNAGNEIANNVWFGLGEAVGTDCDANACEANEVVAAAAFIDASADFHLAAPLGPGVSLAPPHDVDMDGMTRGADGSWDLGAFEFAR